MNDPDRILSRLMTELTDDERNSAVVYRFLPVIEAGTSFVVPHLTIPAQRQASLAFVDQEPLANWGHSCRYLLIDQDTGQSTSIPARFPPFTPESRNDWRMVYRAPNLPDGVIHAPSSPADA